MTNVAMLLDDKVPKSGTPTFIYSQTCAPKTQASNLSPPRIYRTSLIPILTEAISNAKKLIFTDL